MSKLRVNFLAGGFGFLPVDATVFGELAWDTAANVLSHVSVTGYGPYKFLPAIVASSFSPPPATYPPGSLTFFELADASGTVLFQLNYGDRGYTDRPIIPAPGVYVSVPFDIGGSGVGRNAPGTGAVVVSPY